MIVFVALVPDIAVPSSYAYLYVYVEKPPVTVVVSVTFSFTFKVDAEALSDTFGSSHTFIETVLLIELLASSLTVTFTEYVPSSE